MVRDVSRRDWKGKRVGWWPIMWGGLVTEGWRMPSTVHMWDFFCLKGKLETLRFASTNSPDLIFLSPNTAVHFFLLRILGTAF